MYYYDSIGGADYLLYMGKDKFENEDLIRWGWPEDVWFHVDKLSSAHVYLRLPQGVAWDAIPAEILQECCQLCKANSIEGVKLSDTDIIYTPWSNLKKTGAMDAGTQPPPIVVTTRCVDSLTGMILCCVPGQVRILIVPSCVQLRASSELFTHVASGAQLPRNF